MRLILLAIASYIATVMPLFFLVGGGAKAQDAYCTVTGTTLTCTGVSIANCPSGQFVYLNSSGILDCQPVGVTLTVPSDLSVSPSTPTISGTIAVSKVPQTANTFSAAPDGSNGVNSNRTISATDIASALSSAGVITSSNFATELSSTIAAGVTPLTIAQMLAISSPNTGAVVFISDTHASVAATWHGTIAAGGSTTVKGYAFYTGSVWEWQ